MKGKRLKSLGGTVLIMVLTVMLVLIIMLMATLTVVTTASQRIYTKYEEQQAYYTARSALDVFTKMLNDSTYGNTVSGTFETQGYHIQKSLYDIKAQSDPTGTNPVKNTNPYAGAIGVMASQPYIEYEASLPDLNKGTDKYGKFDDGTLKIKVEVLDRTLNCGSDGTPATGKRTKDAMKLKITATTSFEGIESSAAMTLSTKAPAATTADRAVTVTGGGSMSFNNTSILGGLVAPVNASVGNDPCIWGNIFIGDGFSSAVSLHTTVTEGEWIYIRGKDNGSSRDPINWTNSGMDIRGVNTTSDDAKMPNFFMDGDVNIGTDTSFGIVGNDVRTIITGDLNWTQASDVIVNGDLYVMGDVKIWQAKTLTVTGDLYIGGDCDWHDQSKIIVSGNMYVSGTMYPYQTGTPAAVSNLTVGSDTDNAAFSAVGTTIPITISGFKYGSKTPQQVELELKNNNGEIKIDWDGKIFNMTSEQRLRQQYHWYSDLNEGTITASEYAFLSGDDLEKLMDQSADFEYPTDFKRIHEYVDAEHGGTAFGTPVKLEGGGSINAPGKYVFDSNGTWFNQNFNGNPFIIDAGGEVEIYIKPGNYSANNGKIIVETGTTVKFYGVGDYTFNQLPIVTREFENGGDLYVGTYGNDGTSATLLSMPISYYFEGDSDVYLDNSSTILIGHIYIPRGTVRNSSSAGVNVSNRLKYNNVDYMTNGGKACQFSILGSVICNGYNVGDSAKGGVAFVKASAEVSTPGLPCLQFNVSQYTRQ